MIIGIDHGYGCMKTANSIFTTGVTAYEKEPYTMQNVVKYEGKYYVCGSGRQTLQRDKTQDDSYYILTLCAIAKELKHRNAGNKVNIIIAAGLPLTRFSQDRESFTKYLKRHVMQPVKFEFEREPFRVFIDEVSLFPQGVSAVYENINEMQNEGSVIVCDIGSWTVDTFRIDNGTPNSETCRSLELGLIRMMDKILEEVRSCTGLSITSAQAERVLKSLPCSVDEKAQEIINYHGKLYIDRLLRSLIESGFDITAVPTFFMGGGASMIEKIEDKSIYAPMKIIKDVRANAIAYEQLAHKIMGGSQ